MYFWENIWLIINDNLLRIKILFFDKLSNVDSVGFKKKLTYFSNIPLQFVRSHINQLQNLFDFHTILNRTFAYFNVLMALRLSRQHTFQFPAVKSADLTVPRFANLQIHLHFLLSFSVRLQSVKEGNLRNENFAYKASTWVLSEFERRLHKGLYADS